MTVTSCARRSAITSKSTSTSWLDSADVGSSMIEDADVLEQRPGDLDQLLLADRQVADQRVRVEVLAEPAQHVAGCGALARRGRRTAGRGAAPGRRTCSRRSTGWGTGSAPGG